MNRYERNLNMKSSTNRQRPNTRKRNLPLPLVISFDILLVGVGLVIFALFHHVLPRDIKTSGIVLPNTVIAATTSPSATKNPTTQTSASSNAGQTTGTTAESTQETTANGLWGAKFAGKFTSGAVEKTAASYKSANINISVKKVQANSVTYFIADIYLRDIQYFRTAFAGGKFAHGISDEALDIANENNAILAMSGDYYGIHDEGVVIRNGQLYREAPMEDVLVMNNDGSMDTFTKDEFDIEKIKVNGAWQAWSFGPMLLDDGQPMTTFNSKVTPRNPRAAIGYYEPGHYCFVLVDGRQEGYSIGMTMKEMSQLFYDLGCSTAYNLDGGQSAVMTFTGKVTNKPYHGGRKVSDILYIGE